MRMGSVEEVGVDARNPLQFFVKGKGPAGPVTWTLESRDVRDTSDWVAAIKYTTCPPPLT
jgi:hypothetical protein